MSRKVAGLASAFDAPSSTKPTSGVTTLASRFESPQKAENPQATRVSDLASQFNKSDSLTPTPTTTTTVPSRVSQKLAREASPDKPAKVSDLTKAFSEPPSTKAQASGAFAAAQSTFENSSSKVSAAAGKLDSVEKPGAKVAGVARTFESRDLTSVAGKPMFAVGKVEKKKKEEKIETNVEGFANVASRFEKGVAGEREREIRDEGEGAKNRFRDAAKMFGGS